MSRKTEIRDYVAKTIGRLSYLNAAGCASGDFAALRDGAGKTPNESTKAMLLALKDIPEEFMDTDGVPTKEQWAIFTAITLFALHQQGHSKSVHRFGQTMGKAFRKMYRDRTATKADEAFSVKLCALSRTRNIKLFATKLKSIINWMSETVPSIDYAALAVDIYEWQIPKARNNVFMRWATDFNRSK